jgi:hypothetical protein
MLLCVHLLSAKSRYLSTIILQKAGFFAETSAGFPAALPYHAETSAGFLAAFPHHAETFPGFPASLPHTTEHPP